MNRQTGFGVGLLSLFWGACGVGLDGAGFDAVAELDGSTSQTFVHFEATGETTRAITVVKSAVLPLYDYPGGEILSATCALEGSAEEGLPLNYSTPAFVSRPTSASLPKTVKLFGINLETQRGPHDLENDGLVNWNNLAFLEKSMKRGTQVQKLLGDEWPHRYLLRVDGQVLAAEAWDGSSADTLLALPSPEIEFYVSVNCGETSDDDPGFLNITAAQRNGILTVQDAGHD